MRRSSLLLLLCGLAIGLTGCPKKIPQPEIDAAESSFKDLEGTKDCAPETYQAAKTMMDRARALLQEERYDEARTAFLAARELAEKAKRECEEKRKEEERRKKEAPPPIEPPQEVPLDAAVEMSEGLKSVYFPFNESSLTDEAQATLGKGADYLLNKAPLRIQIEGHCDERGSEEYNLALGERRAVAVRQYLVKLGVNPDRLEIISYGEERPADGGKSDESYGRNRRAEFKEFK